MVLGADEPRSVAAIGHSCTLEVAAAQQIGIAARQGRGIEGLSCFNGPLPMSLASDGGLAPLLRSEGYLSCDNLYRITREAPFPLGGSDKTESPIFIIWRMTSQQTGILCAFPG